MVGGILVASTKAQQISYRRVQLEPGLTNGKARILLTLGRQRHFHHLHIQFPQEGSLEKGFPGFFQIAFA